MAVRSVRSSENGQSPTFMRTLPAKRRQLTKGKGVEMYYSRDRISMCNVCKREYTSFHFEARPGLKVYVCTDCLDSAKSNFIWICLNCGNSYHRAKEVVMGRIYDYGIKEAS